MNALRSMVHARRAILRVAARSGPENFGRIAHQMEAPGARPGAEVFLASLVLRVDRRGRRPRVVLDRQLGAEDVAMGRKIVVGARDRSAAQVEAECALTLDIPMLVLGTEDNVDQRSLVDHIVDASAGEPTIVPRLTDRECPSAVVADARDRRAEVCLQISRSVTA